MRFSLSAPLFGVSLLLFAAVALAAPSRLAVQGHLASANGGPAPDGKYLLFLGLYETADTVKPLHEEIHTGVQVSGGVFALTLGDKKALEPSLFESGQAAWVGVSVDGEPELARVPLLPVPYALSAGHATALACTGCITSDHLDPATLAPYATKAQLAEYAKLAALADYAKKDDLGDAALRGAANLFTKANVFTSTVGLGKSTAPGCSVDIGTDAGSVCVDGAPTLLVRMANDAGTMEKLGKSGQIVYRFDENALFVKVGPVWRRVSFQVICGDGVTEVPEQCDDGDANADAPDKCRTTCTKPVCGDQIVDTDEACDDGNSVPTDACVACKVATCGDNQVQAGVEACDDGNSNPNDGCVGCKAAVCGDGAIYAGMEECDDGPANADAPDKCRVSCKKPKCGDAIQDSGEQCDSGGANANTPNTCRTTCKLPACGDTIKDNGEDCDDGNNQDNDGCSAGCKSESKCGGFDGGEKKLIMVSELNQCLQALGAQFAGVQFIEIAYGHLDYLDNICKAFGYTSYKTTHGGDKCNSSAKMYPSHCGQGWLGAACGNGCGNTNYDAFYCN